MGWYVLSANCCHPHLTDEEARFEEVNHWPRGAEQVTANLRPRSVAIVTILLCCCFVLNGEKIWEFYWGWINLYHDKWNPIQSWLVGRIRECKVEDLVGSGFGWDSLSRSEFLVGMVVRLWENIKDLLGAETGWAYAWWMTTVALRTMTPTANNRILEPGTETSHVNVI